MTLCANLGEWIAQCMVTLSISSVHSGVTGVIDVYVPPYPHQWSDLLL